MRKRARQWRGFACVFLATALVLGIAGLGHMRRSTAAAATARKLPIYSVDLPEKKVALGINCAWDDSDLDSILQTLRDKNVKATFFLVGSFCRHYPEAVRRIADAGHELGSHSNTHPDMTKLDRNEIIKQLDDSRNAIKQACGKEVTLFRPPSGAYNDLVVETARELGWEVIQWDCDTLDWKGGTAPELVVNGTSKVQNGSIILLHAGAKHTAEALPQLIDTVRRQGYDFDCVGNLVLTKPYEIDHAGRQHKIAS